MRVLVVVKANEDSEAGQMPSAEAVAEMGKFNDELIAAGLLVDGAGLHPSSKAKRIKYAAKGAEVIDGPFTETKEALLGFYVLDCASMEEAIQAAMDLQKTNPSAVYELRPVRLYLPGVAFPVTEG